MKRILFFSIACIFTFFLASPLGLFAAPPAGGYEPGQTLDPNCAPSDADCFVRSLTVQDEGTDLSGNVLALNFTGGGVSSSILNGVVEVNVSGTNGVSSLNGLSDTSQTFTVGSSGASPSWSSTGSIHTLNLPIASSVNTGILSATDWTSFNNKISSQWTTSGSNIGYTTGRVGIGTTSPNSSAILDLSSTTLGLLTPRMTTVQRNAIVSPVEGLVVYNTTTDLFNYYDGTQWTTFEKLVGETSTANTRTVLGIDVLANPTQSVAVGREVEIGEFGVSIGYQAGKLSLADYSVLIGNQVGLGANNTRAILIGSRAGTRSDAEENGGSQLEQSILIGVEAGNNISDISGTVAIGTGAAANAPSAMHQNSVFIGGGSGSSALNNLSQSIFIGSLAGDFETVNNNTSIDSTRYSILIGNETSTGGFTKSIALGFQAINTASNQFLIGSTNGPINTTRINGSAGTQCTITTGTGIACTSDERLKDNIQIIEDGILEKIQGLDAVTYTWSQDENSTTQIGFLAQQLETIFPELVATDSEGYKSVFYSQMVPILTKGIQEIYGLVEEMYDSFTSRFIRAEEILCVGDTCINESELQLILEHVEITTQEEQISESSENNSNPQSQSSSPEGQTQEETSVNTEVGEGELVTNQNPVEEIQEEEPAQILVEEEQTTEETETESVQETPTQSTTE